MALTSSLEAIILGRKNGAVAWLVRALLWPLSLAYRSGLALFLMPYALGIRKRFRLPASVVSVGNIAFGGTGKTPAVQEICRILVEQGKRVVVLSRGHGGSARGSVVVSDGETILVGSRESGDEPRLLAQTLPGVPVIVGKDRRASGSLACERFSPDVIVLDDGLQVPAASSRFGYCSAGCRQAAWKRFCDADGRPSGAGRGA